MRRSPRTVMVLAATVAAALVISGCGSISAGSASGRTGGSPDDAVAADTRSPAGVASFEGTVTDASGRPVGGVMLMVSSLAAPPLPVPELAVVTDARGHYVWHGLRPGPYAVSASLGAAAARIELSVVDGRAVTADLFLR